MGAAFFIFLWQEGGGQPVIGATLTIVDEGDLVVLQEDQCDLFLSQTLSVDLELLEVQDFSLTVTTTDSADTELLITSSCDIKVNR